MEPTRYAYWSAQQYKIMKRLGSKKVNIYLVVKDGVEKEVGVTEIMRFPKELPHAERFDDSIYLGKVIRFVRDEI